LLGLAIPIAGMLVLAGIGEWLFSHRIYAEHERAGEEGAAAHERALAILVGVTVLAAVGSAGLAIIR
jgi:hypothetical protein